MARLHWLLLALALLTAGCLGLGSDDETGEADEPAEAASENASEATGAETEASSGDIGDNETDPAALERGLETPPGLVDGEWWTVEIQSQFTGLEARATIVKVGGHGQKYMIGMPDAEFVEEAVLLHMPPQGSVDAATFGYPVHGSVFEPVQFPLEEGRTWETSWSGEALEAEVAEAGDGEALVEMEGESASVEVQYEAELGYPRSVTLEGYGSYEVVDHGYGYEGDVHVPWEAEEMFLNGRFLGAIDTEFSPAPPREEVEVTGDYDEAVVGLLLGSFAEATPGYYEVSATDPDGNTHEASLVATPNGDSFDVASTVVEDPAGTWEMEYVAGGPGLAAVEAIGYEAMHVVLEDGEFRMMDMD